MNKQILHLKMKGLTLRVVIFICVAGCSLIAAEDGIGELPDEILVSEDATQEQIENEKEEGDGRSASKRRSSSKVLKYIY